MVWNQGVGKCTVAWKAGAATLELRCGRLPEAISVLILRSLPPGPREARPDDKLRKRLEGWQHTTRGHPSRRAQERAPQDEVGECFKVPVGWIEPSAKPISFGNAIPSSAIDGYRCAP